LNSLKGIPASEDAGCVNIGAFRAHGFLSRSSRDRFLLNSLKGIPASEDAGCVNIGAFRAHQQGSRLLWLACGLALKLAPGWLERLVVTRSHPLVGCADKPCRSLL
jgi:hypothetical protein